MAKALTPYVINFKVFVTLGSDRLECSSRADKRMAWELIKGANDLAYY
jgi:hypothetical protein